LLISACSDTVATSPRPSGASFSAVKFSEVGSSVAWNQTARDLIVARNLSNPGTEARILTYLSVAQNNAIVAAEDTKDHGNHASPAAAAAGASLVVLKSFFPLDAALLDGKLLAQRAATAWPGEQQKDFAAGEAVGRTIGALVVVYAATDRVGLTPAPANPGGPGNWTGVNTLRGFYGARTFALLSGDQFRPGPPPAFGSAAFNAALAEIRSLSDHLSPAQLAIAQLWNNRGPAYMNSVAVDLITSHHNSEREAARVLALANMAAFDVLNACFDAKLAFYLFVHHKPIRRSIFPSASRITRRTRAATRASPRRTPRCSRMRSRTKPAAWTRWSKRQVCPACTVACTIVSTATWVTCSVDKSQSSFCASLEAVTRQFRSTETGHGHSQSPHADARVGE
jgi:hypothetical protein